MQIDPSKRVQGNALAIRRRLSLVERLSLVDGATAALQDLSTVIHQVPNGELSEVVGRFGHLRALLEAGMVVATAEADRRGEIQASQTNSITGWIRDADWHQTSGSASSIGKAAAILNRSDLCEVADSIRSSDLTPQAGIVVATEFDKMAPDLMPAAKPAVLRWMIDIGEEHGAAAVHQLHDLLLEQFGEQGVFQDRQDRLHRSIELSAGHLAPSGLWHHQLTLDPEGHAVLEAAIGPLSAPQPSPDGDPDIRSSSRRRGQALLEVCRRSAAAADGIPSQAKATLHVTMRYQDLVDRLGAGVVTGTMVDGIRLAPDTVRKLACDAQIIPTVLGSAGELLAWGAAAGCSPHAKWKRSGNATGTAPSTAATHHPNGPTPTTSRTGQMEVRPRSTTARCSAAVITRLYIATNCPAGWRTAGSVGTEGPAPISTHRNRKPVDQGPVCGFIGREFAAASSCAYELAGCFAGHGNSGHAGAITLSLPCPNRASGRSRSRR